MKRDYEGKEDPDMTDGVVVLLALVFFLFMALLLIILCIYAILRKRTYMELPLPRSDRPWAQRLSSSSSISEDGHLRSGALDVKIIEALPIFVYTSSVERFKLGLSGTDCSVCLQDFEEGEKVRVLPDCKHTFHTGCIDMWFHSHSNCPLCRTKVEATIEEGAPDASNGVENVVTDMDFVMEQGHNSSSFTSETFAEMGINSAPEINNLQPEEICSPSGSRFCRLHSLKRILSGRSRDGRVFPSTQNDEIEEFL